MSKAYNHTSEEPTDAPRVIIGIATVDRGDIVTQAVQKIGNQKRLPDLVVVSGVSESDFGGLKDEELPFPVDFLKGTKGSCAQRNLILAGLSANDVLLIMDDDFLLAPDYLENLETVMKEHPDLVVVTGNVMADGILGPGMNFEQGDIELQVGLKRPTGTSITTVRNGYGCNMAVRMKPVLEHQLQFDEALPLYGWLEDVDFSYYVGKYGRIVRAEHLRGVHLGTKSGRTPGVKLGYSQVANLVYLWRKGSIVRKALIYRTSRNIASNLKHSLFPVAWADHRGRLRGNLMALVDVVLGRCDPSKVTRL